MVVAAKSQSSKPSDSIRFTDTITMDGSLTFGKRIPIGLSEDIEFPSSLYSGLSDPTSFSDTLEVEDKLLHFYLLNISLVDELSIDVYQNYTEQLVGTSGELVSSSGGGIFDIHIFYPGTIVGDAFLLVKVPIARAATFPANFEGSYANAEVSATVETSILIKKNEVECGVLTFLADGSTGAFTSTSGLQVDFSIGDTISLECPSADATLQDIGIVLAGTRT